MPVTIDVDGIIHGSDQKIFDIAHQKMTENYTSDSAEEFFNTYKSKSLLFILKNISTIVRESYFGTNFVLDLLLRGFIPFHMIADLYNEVDELSKKAQRIGKHDQFVDLTNLLNAVMDIKNDYANTIGLFSIAVQENGKEFIETLYSYIYEIKETGSEEELDQLFYSTLPVSNAYVTVASLITIAITCYDTDQTSIIAEILKGIINRNGCTEVWFSNVTFSDTDEDLDRYKKNQDLVRKYQNDGFNAISYVIKDEALKSVFEKLPNRNSYFMLYGIGEHGNTKPVMNESAYDLDTFPIFSTEDFMNRVVTESEGENFMNEETRKINVYDYMKRLEAYYESEVDKEYRDAFVENREVYKNYVESMENAIGEIRGKIAMLEWTDNGEPDSVVQKHIMTQKEIDAIKAAKENAKRKQITNIQDEMNSSKEVNTSERKNIVQSAIEACDSIEDAKAHITSSSKEDFVSGKKHDLCLGSFKKENIKEVLKAVKENLVEFDNVKVTEDNYYTIYITVTESVMTEGTEEPEKPKEDFATRVQNKAMDKEAARAEKRALNKEKITKLKNAGKAVSTGPKEKGAEVKGFFNKIASWDIKRRKQFFLKPGYRHKIFRNMRLALMYGYFDIKYLPVLMLLRHFSKDKDRRLRNELTRELDAEIRICDEKINDANSDGDKQEKYKLMRIKEKLVAEKNRVQLNSKYI